MEINDLRKCAPQFAQEQNSSSFSVPNYQPPTTSPHFKEQTCEYHAHSTLPTLDGNATQFIHYFPRRPLLRCSTRRRTNKLHLRLRRGRAVDRTRRLALEYSQRMVYDAAGGVPRFVTAHPLPKL